MGKWLRDQYFAYNPWVREYRRALGPEEFDRKYRALYEFLSTLNPGQYFYVKDVCRKDPGNHDLVVKMCDLYYHMDWFVNLEYDPATDKVTILPPLHDVQPPWHPPDVYSKIIKAPRLWGIDINDLI